MSLQAPPFDADIYTCADWVEIKLLSTNGEPLYYSSLERVWEARREAEDVNYEGSDGSFDDWLNLVCQQIQDRADSLGQAYPFGFVEDDTGFRLVCGLEELGRGQIIYLYCLMLSSLEESNIFEDAPFPITNRMRDLFQACAAWAAGGVVTGNAYAFGWPRPDGSPFLDALKTVFHNHVQEGIVRPVAPQGASGREKDGGVDVIAWTGRVDRSPGRIYLVGQVASGKNWKEKSVREYIDSLHDNWFDRKPPSTAIPAMFIPHCIKPNDCAISAQVAFDMARYGNIYYRCVLPHYAAVGLDLAGDGLFIHRAEDLGEVDATVRTFIGALAPERPQSAVAALA